MYGRFARVPTLCGWFAGRASVGAALASCGLLSLTLGTEKHDDEAAASGVRGLKAAERGGLSSLSKQRREALEVPQPEAQLSIGGSKKKHGLLGELSDDKYYSRNLEPEELASMLLNGALFLKAAQADADRRSDCLETHLQIIKRKSSAFINSDEAYDRDELRRALKRTFEKEGQLICLLGGKHVGKTTLLRELTNDLSIKGKNK